MAILVCRFLAPAEVMLYRNASQRRGTAPTSCEVIWLPDARFCVLFLLVNCRPSNQTFGHQIRWHQARVQGGGAGEAVPPTFNDA